MELGNGMTVGVHSRISFEDLILNELDVYVSQLFSGSPSIVDGLNCIEAIGNSSASCSCCSSSVVGNGGVVATG